MNKKNINYSNLAADDENTSSDFLLVVESKKKNNIAMSNIKLSVVMAKIGSSLVNRQYESSANCKNSANEK